MWTAPRVNCQMQPASRYAVTLGYGLRHSARQIGRRPGIGRSVPAYRCLPAFHSIGGCSFGLIDIPFRMDDDLFGQGGQVDPSGPLRSNGRAWGTAFGTASGTRTLGSWHAPIAASAIFVTDGIWRRQIEPRRTWRTTARQGVSCDKRRPCQSP